MGENVKEVTSHAGFGQHPPSSVPECRGLAGRQEPHKASFCLDFGLSSKWEPAELSACPHAAVPCCPAPRQAHMEGKQRRDCVAPCSLTNPLPSPVPADGRCAWLLLLTFLIFVFFKDLFFLMLLFYYSKCSQTRRESITSVLFWNLQIEIMKCYVLSIFLVFSGDWTMIFSHYDI